MLAEELGAILRAKNLTISTAESCTGGTLGEMITAVPGSSEYYLGGVISYSNNLKERLLSVDHELLSAKGAVSEEVAIAMARGCRSQLGSDLGVSVTGIAGPSGGTPDKPVGLVFIAVSSAKGDLCSRELYTGDRQAVRAQSATRALQMTIEHLKNEF